MMSSGSSSSDTEDDVGAHEENTEMKDASQPFFEDIPDDKKRLYELKYNVHITCGQRNNEYEYKCTIVNKQSQQFITYGTSPSKQSAELQGLLYALEYIYANQTNEQTSQYINVDVQTDSVYLVNLVREWLAKWNTDFSVRPHAELLERVWNFVSLYEKNIEISWVTPSS